MKRFIVIIGIVLFLLPTIAVSKTKVTFLNFFNAPELWEPFFKKAFEEFEKANPDIEVEHIFTPYGEMRQKLITMVAGGTPPDVTSVPSDVAPEFISRGLLLPLDPYLKKYPDIRNKLNDIYPSRVQAYKVKGQLYAFPIDIGPDGIYYNKDEFDKAGLAYPKIDWTIDDLLNIAKKLKSVSRYGFTFDRSLHRLYSIYSALGGLPYYDTKLTKVQFGHPNSVKALQILANLCKEGIAPTSAELTTITQQAAGTLPFAAGIIPMQHMWIGAISYLHKPGVPVKNWDTAPIPKGVRQVQISSGQGFAIVKGSKNPEAAFKVISWFIKDETQIAMAKAGVWFPARISLGPIAQPEDKKPEHFKETFIDTMVKYGFRPYWYVPGWAEVNQKISSVLEGLWNGRYDAKEAARRIESEVQGIKLTPIF